MKKWILSVVVLMSAMPLSAQTTNLGGAPSNSTEMNTSPSGMSLGGSMSGTNSTTAPTNIPSNTLPRSSELGSGTIQNDQMRIQEEQERIENNTSPVGGSTPSNYDTTLPRGTSPSPTTTPLAPGVGTGNQTTAPIR